MIKSWLTRRRTLRLYSRCSSRVLSVLTVLLLSFCQAQLVFVNEIHYDNSGSDTDEFVEILGPAGANLGDYDLVFYNGANGQVYRTETLSGVIADEGGTGHGTLSFQVEGIQNGAPDGLALVQRSLGGLLEFLSYEGTIVASGGAASRMTSVALPVSESSSTTAGSSLQRQGSGREAGDFEWTGPAAASPGVFNANQTIIGSLTPLTSVSLSQIQLAENAGPESVTLSIRLLPVPDESQEIQLVSSQPERFPVPESVTAPSGGVLGLTLGPVDNEEVDGSSEVVITLTDPLGVRDPVSVSVTVLDDDRAKVRFNGTLRVATYNILNSVGPKGSASFEAIKATIARVNPDVIGFQETSGVGNFSQLKALLIELGFLVDRQFLATMGDGFENGAAVNGQFTSDQFVALASRYPIKRTVQIGRGVAGRRELTRYPLYVEVDVPELEVDPVFVVVHLKAGRQQSDQFRKVVEAYRVREFVEDQGKDARRDPVVLLGDFNENRESSNFQTARFTIPPRFTDGSSLPASYQLGRDLEEAVNVLTYRTFPDRAFQSAGYRVLEALHADGVNNGTFIGFDDSPLDYLIVSKAIRSLGTPRAEVVNSLLDRAFDGLPKVGATLAPDTESRASDHRLVFADLNLTPLSEVEVILDETMIHEEGESITGRVQMAEALEEDLSGRLVLATASIGAIDSPTWTITAGSLVSSEFTFKPNQDGVARADLRATLTAQIDDRVVGQAQVDVMNLEPSGQVLISQYREPVAQTTGRALELYHAGDRVIDLSKTPLTLHRYPDGSRDRILETSVNIGLWKPGKVVVIGDQTARTFLQETGFLPSNAMSLSDGTRGTAFTTSSNEILFVLDNLGFNGDDALEIQLGWERADVFGRVGQDPGEGWTGHGVTTNDTNLELSSIALYGSIGFDDPSDRFMVLEELMVLEGFGVPPMFDAVYRQWLDERGVPLAQRGFGDDPDADGLANGLEFVLLQDPLEISGNPVRLKNGVLSFSYRASEALQFIVENSQDLQTWEMLEGVTLETDEMVMVLTLPEGTTGFLRVRATIDF
ncbi:MAG: endonuclease/exonuclease/phosphatase family metal-dependent hydrolase [Verrucomicrobiales bacterium]|jgi:endonuclease/exonuclease/phosphatase family metal-dependent hydrolase